MNDAPHQRWEGRHRVEEHTVWAMEVRGVCFRCLAMDDGNKVEVKPPGRVWKKLHYSNRHPLRLLRTVVEGHGMDQLFDEEER